MILSTFFEVVDDHRISLLLCQLGLRRRNHQRIGVAGKKRLQRLRRAPVKEQPNVFADFHALFSGAHAHRDLAERAGESRRDGFAAQTLERRNLFLSEQDQGIAVHWCSDVDKIRALEIGGDGRGPALVDVERPRDDALHRYGRADDVDGHVETALREVAPIQCHKQRQTGGSRARGRDFEPCFLRLAESALLGGPQQARERQEQDQRRKYSAPAR